MKELLFLLVLFVSNVIQAITGFAGTVLAMPPSVYLLGLDHAKVRSDRMLLILQMKRDSRYLKYRGGFEWLKSCGSYVLQ